MKSGHYKRVINSVNIKSRTSNFFKVPPNLGFLELKYRSFPIFKSSFFLLFAPLPYRKKGPLSSTHIFNISNYLTIHIVKWMHVFWSIVGSLTYNKTFRLIPISKFQTFVFLIWKLNNKLVKPILQQLVEMVLYAFTILYLLIDKN